MSQKPKRELIQTVVKRRSTVCCSVHNQDIARMELIRCSITEQEEYEEESYHSREKIPSNTYNGQP